MLTSPATVSRNRGRRGDLKSDPLADEESIGERKKKRFDD
jgi:hypothetical protein